MKRRAYFPFGGKKARLPRNPIRTYFDCSSTESCEVEPQTKLEEMAYAMTHGLNFEKEIKDYIKQHRPIIDENVVKKGLVHYISFMRSGNLIDVVTEHLEDLLSLPEAIELFKKELLLRYELLQDGELDDDEIIHQLKLIPMDYNAIANEEGMNQEKFNYIITHPTKA